MSSPTGIQAQAADPSVPANTTFQEDLTAAGQRHVNITWEYTQAIIAVIITIAVVCSAFAHVTSPEVTNAFFLIIGFYFSRTNHTAIGSTGAKATDNQKYIGR